MSSHFSCESLLENCNALSENLLSAVKECYIPHPTSQHLCKKSFILFRQFAYFVLISSFRWHAECINDQRWFPCSFRRGRHSKPSTEWRSNQQGKKLFLSYMICILYDSFRPNYREWSLKMMRWCGGVTFRTTVVKFSHFISLRFILVYPANYAPFHPNSSCFFLATSAFSFFLIRI